MTERRWGTRLLGATLTGAIALQGGAFAEAPAQPEAPIILPLIERALSEAVLIEVYATGPSGELVTDLKKEELILKIDQQPKPKPIASLDFIEAVPQASGAAAEAVPAVPPGDSGTSAQPAASRRRMPRRFLLFYEDSFSSPFGLTQARRATETLISNPGLPDDQFALAAYEENRKLRVLHDFTSDRAALLKVLDEGIKDLTRYSNVEQEQADHLKEIDDARRQGNPAPDTSNKATFYATQDYMRMRQILAAVKTLIDSLAPWPGYKAIVFMGDGIAEDPSNFYGYVSESGRTLRSDFGELQFAAAAANVTIHSVSTLGLAAGDSRTTAAAARRSNSMTGIALGTGGISLTSNDLAGALGEVESSTHGYYVLSYLPEGPPDGLNHGINLKTTRRGVTLRYRRTFARLLPEEARTRAIQAAYLTPELHSDLGLELAAVAGPPGGNGQLLDLVLYLPPGKTLFLRQPGGLTATLEVGFVALDGGGNETLRLARRVVVAIDPEKVHDVGPLALDLFSRVTLPAGTQKLTAVLSDLQAGSLGADRITLVAGGPAARVGVTGLSLYAMEEKSLWVEVESKRNTASTQEPSSYTIGPSLRTSFRRDEKVQCGFKSGAGGGAPSSPLRIAVGRDDKPLIVQPIEGAAGRDAGGAAQAGTGAIRVWIPLKDLTPGHYWLRVEEMLASGPSELGRLAFQVGASPRQ